MELKEILLAAGLGLSPLFTSQNIYAQEVAKVEKPAIENAVVESEIIKPSLEEIAKLIEKLPAEILKDAIEKGDIKKFEYTRQKNNNDFYKFINENFNSQVLFLYVATDDPLCLRERERLAKGSTLNLKGFSGAAISFLYISRNLKQRNKDVGFLFFEEKGLYGDGDWQRLARLFSLTDIIEFPSYAEFNKDSNGRYKFEKIDGCGVKTPEVILRSINGVVNYFSKR